MSVLGPATGPLAHGEGEGPGRMVEPDEIVAWATRALLKDETFAGKRVVVTAGPTREPLDPVRVVTNRSSGRMGYALARAAWQRGANVTLIAGPGALPDPFGVQVIRVETTEQMKDAVAQSLSAADCLIMAAAPADYLLPKPAAEKSKREVGPLKLLLEPTQDILGTTAYWRRSSSVIVGFALESGDLVASAREKLAKKQLDLIVANSATEPGSGTETLTNKCTLVTAKTVEELPLMSKDDVAVAILDRVGMLMAARG